MEPIDNPNKGISGLNEAQKKEVEKYKPKVEQELPGLKRSTSVEDMQEKVRQANIKAVQESEAYEAKSLENLRKLDEEGPQGANYYLRSFGIDKEDDFCFKISNIPKVSRMFVDPVNIHANPIGKKSMISSRYGTVDALTKDIENTIKEIRQKYSKSALVPASLKSKFKQAAHGLTGAMVRATHPSDSVRKELTDRLTALPILVHILKLRGNDNQRADIVNVSKLGDPQNQQIKTKLQAVLGQEITDDMDVLQTASSEFFIKAPGKDLNTTFIFLARMGDHYKIMDLNSIEGQSKGKLSVSEGKKTYAKGGGEYFETKMKLLKQDATFFEEKISALNQSKSKIRELIEQFKFTMTEDEKAALISLQNEVKASLRLHERNHAYVKQEMIDIKNTMTF